MKLQIVIYNVSWFSFESWSLLVSLSFSTNFHTRNYSATICRNLVAGNTRRVAFCAFAFTPRLSLAVLLATVFALVFVPYPKSIACNKSPINQRRFPRESARRAWLVRGSNYPFIPANGVKKRLKYWQAVSQQISWMKCRWNTKWRAKTGAEKKKREIERRR